MTTTAGDVTVTPFPLTSPAESDQQKQLKKGIAELYDESSGIWENIWGEHMHHGFYETDNVVDLSGHRAAQIRMVEQTLSFASVSGINL